MRKAIVLLSGGLDSSTTLYLARRRHKSFCLIFDYGQRHKKEIRAAKSIAKKAGCQYKVLKVPFPGIGSSLTDRSIKVPGKRSLKQIGKGIPTSYVPARNIVFLSMGLSFAEALKADKIFIGAHTQDYSGYPDCRPQFYRAFRDVVKKGTKSGARGKRIKVETPLINKTKAQIIKLGKSLGVPFELTWSCYNDKEHPCGVCDSCILRAKGFKEAGLNDR